MFFLSVLTQYVLNTTKSIFQGGRLGFPNIHRSNLLKMLLCTPVLFFHHLHFQMCFSPSPVIKVDGCMGQIVSPTVRRCLRGNHLGPRVPFFSPYHIWNTDLLCSSYFGICESPSCCHICSLQSSRWERSQLLEALSMEKKKSDFSIIRWKCYL